MAPVVNKHRMVTRAKLGFRQPALFTAAPLSPIPKTFRSALADPNWRAAMEEEHAALLRNHTWDLVPRPPRANVVTGKWIFKHKLQADGSLERYKARWVLRGFTQRPVWILMRLSVLWSSLLLSALCYPWRSLDIGQFISSTSRMHSSMASCPR